MGNAFTRKELTWNPAASLPCITGLASRFPESIRLRCGREVIPWRLIIAAGPACQCVRRWRYCAWKGVPESGLLERDLSRYAAVFLCNVGRFGLEEANVLYEYLREAGTVVFFLGDLVQAQDYNEALGARRGERRILPARLIEPVATARYQFDPQDYQHPIIAPLKARLTVGC